MSEINIRFAKWEDVDALISLEQKVWEQHRTPILTREDMVRWLSDSSPFFLVAEAEGGICGYYFGRQIQFDKAEIQDFLLSDKATGRGFIDHRHDPLADAVYGISVASTMPGAGRALNKRVHELLGQMRIKYFLGFTRLPGLRGYLDSVGQDGRDSTPSSDEIAHWYAYCSAKLLRLRIWEMFPIPEILFPPPLRPDPVLAFHTRGTRLGLLGVLPHYMPDPASCDYGALLLSETPHT